MKAISTLIYSNQIGIRIFRHVIFWVTDILFYLSVVTVNGEIDPKEVYAVVMRTFPLALTTYFILYYLIPVFSKQNDNGKLILWILGVLIFIGVGMRMFNFYMVYPILDITPVKGSTLFDFPSIVRNMFSCMSVICMAVTIKLVKNKSELQQRNEQLETEKKLTELNFLKAQMQPHFLFNVLNTLYSETIQESGKAQQVVLNLSNLLRFILDECNKPHIPVHYEIQVIKNFVELEKLRHGARLQVSLKVNEDLDQSAMVSPLIFLPFVENSFKHSLQNNRGPVQIVIEIGMKDERIFLFVENNNHLNGTPRINGHPSGKGNANTKRQLDLLYGHHYSLTIDDRNDKYQVMLAIPVKQITHG
ncbi:MAG TPA: histidine kinase [Cyclobacteriaceae bacterium]|nr:histidine kinase [Cyclobacteriaceae bacterium]